ncbi:hypothetical protein [Mycolicibacterium sp. CBMA 361]|uniref:hypothetical protein n=1 Tax=Mycolicibacterium sp. CBMA 361 TaxID=2606610 RepID=UPI0012DD3FC0|nr:hypothetical protein [Mycolicibacterium sp. CBMA 361]MUM33606.1 hypothetical protein [Mycolicibacterium sp. CBMA 361]
MQKVITVAFDIDGTLRDNTIGPACVANERIRTLLITLAGMKNTHILLWSGGGEDYARRVARALGIETPRGSPISRSTTSRNASWGC